MGLWEATFVCSLLLLKIVLVTRDFLGIMIGFREGRVPHHLSGSSFILFLKAGVYHGWLPLIQYIGSMFVVGLIFFSLSFSFSLSLSLFFPVLKSELFPGHTDRSNSDSSAHHQPRNPKI